MHHLPLGVLILLKLLDVFLRLQVERSLQVVMEEFSEKLGEDSLKVVLEEFSEKPGEDSLKVVGKELLEEVESSSSKGRLFEVVSEEFS